MKLKLSLDQANEIIRRHFNLPSDAEVAIQRPRKGPFAPLRTMIEEIDKMRYMSDQKIMAIKRYRETCSSDLDQAKWAVENWGITKGWITQNRRAPRSHGHYPTYTLA